MLRRHDIAVSVFATGLNWDLESLASLQAIGVEFNIPPPIIRKSRKLSALYSRITWPTRIPRGPSSLYCIGAGRSHLLMNRLRPEGTVSINHEIVLPPGEDSLAGECAQRLDATVANSRKVAELMQEYWPEKPIRVIPFLTSDRPVPAPNRRPRSQSEPMKVVYLGRLVEQKRPDQLVRRWPALTRQTALSSARLDVFGYDPDGRMSRELHGFVAQAGLASRVQIKGKYDLADLPRILSQSDLVVLPSLWEGLPLVLVEAMSHGVPFVATAAGGTEELGEGNPDVRITGTDWTEFETGLIEMAERLQCGGVDPLRLHAWVEERYGFDAVSAKWLACLEKPRQFFGLHD